MLIYYAFKGLWYNYILHISVIHCLVADESNELPPPGTKTSEYTFKNSKILSKLNYVPLYVIGFFYPAFITKIDGKSLTPYLSTNILSELLIKPKFNFF